MSLQADKAAATNWAAFERADQAGHSEYVRRAKRYNDYYLGEQWTKEDSDALENEGRPFLTLNQIMQVINAVYGNYSKTRADIIFKPKRGPQSVELAEVTTRMADHILESNNYHEQVEPSVVMDGMIEDRGYFDIRMDFSDNILGEASISSLDPRSVILDPDAREYDPATWGWVMIDRWMTLDNIELFYGKKAREKLNMFADSPNDTYGHKSVRWETFGDNVAGVPLSGGEIKEARVLERQHRQLTMVRELVHLATGHTRVVPDKWSDAELASVAQTYGMATRKRLQKRIRWTVSVDKVVLHDDWSPYDEMTVVPFFPIFRRGNPSGLVKHLIDPQEQLNKIESQILHIINTTANSGWTVEAGSLVNMDTEDLEQKGSKTGLVIEYKKNAQAPDKIQPNTIPSGLESYASKARNYIADIPGASALLGQMPTSEVSGVTLERQQASALQGLKMMADNLQLTRKLVAKRVLNMIQSFYTEPRVYYVTQWRDPSEPVEEVAVNQRQAAGQLVNDMSAGVFDVTVSMAPARDTFQDQQFAESLELANAGVPIPKYRMVLHSRLHGKQQIADEVKQLEGLGEPGPMEQEMQKIKLREAMATVAKLEGEVEKIKTEAGLNMVKGQSEAAGVEREQFEAITQHEREIARIRAQLEMHNSKLENDQQLARIHTASNQSIKRYTTIMDTLDKEKDRNAELQRELIADAREERAREDKAESTDG